MIAATPLAQRSRLPTNSQRQDCAHGLTDTPRNPPMRTPQKDGGLPQGGALPVPLALSAEVLDSGGLYLLDSGMELLLYVDHEAPDVLVQARRASDTAGAWTQKCKGRGRHGHGGPFSLGPHAPGLRPPCVLTCHPLTITHTNTAATPAVTTGAVWCAQH